MDAEAGHLSGGRIAAGGGSGLAGGGAERSHALRKGMRVPQCPPWKPAGIAT